MREIVFELCAETLSACHAAAAGGAARIELCSALSEGGITPSHGLIAQAVTAGSPPVHVLIRPRGGDFVYSSDEVAVMRADILHAKQLGAAGVVFGLLTESGKVDEEYTAELVQIAGPLEVTFHRAFDAVISQGEALETVIALGCKRVLTSGAESNVLAGAERLHLLVEQAQGRIAIAAGGGLRIHTAAEVARQTGAQHFHGSLQQKHPGASPTVTAEAVRAMIRCLKEA